MSVPSSVARGLRDFEPHLAMQWSERAEKWQCVSWLERAGFWCHNFFWETVDGKYRELPGSADPIIARLTQCVDTHKLGRSPRERMDALNKMFDGAGDAVRAAKERKLQEIGKEYARDLASDKILSAPGYIRSRVGLASGSEVHRKAVEEIESADF